MPTHFCQTGISTSDRVDDSERLLLGYFDVIRDSPSHIYHSALPLLPSSSWVRKCYGADASGKVRVVMGLPDKWDTCSRTMMFEDELTACLHWGDTIAIGLGCNVVFLDVITGIRTSVLCGHKSSIRCLASSQDGTLLLSGSLDKTARVWDVQTGAVIRTFSHPFAYFAASISSDGAIVALGTNDGTVRLWDVRTGECNSIKMHDGTVTDIKFSPINSRHFISSSLGGIVKQWDIDGDQNWPSYHEADDVHDLTWTRDGTRFVSCGDVATVRDAESGAVVVKLDAPDKSSSLHLGCFSPDGRFVACADDITIWVWDITISGGRLVGCLVGHSDNIEFLAFPSSLISGSYDRSIKFWKSSSFSMDSTTSDQMAEHGSFPEIQSIKLFAEEGMVVTSDEDGVVKIWDVTTGRCKSSFSTPAEGRRDTHLTRDTLIVVWCPTLASDRDSDLDFDSDSDRNIYSGLNIDSDSDSDSGLDLDLDLDLYAGRGANYHIWDVYKGQLLRKFRSSPLFFDLKISGDASKILMLGFDRIAALSMQTGEAVGHVELERQVDKFLVRGSKVWVNDRPHRIWDFGGPGAPTIEEFLDGPQLKLVKPRRDREVKPCWMVDIVANRVVLYSLERYLDCCRKLKWDGRYLFNWSPSGEDIMIIDFDPACT